MMIRAPSRETVELRFPANLMSRSWTETGTRIDTVLVGVVFGGRPGPREARGGLSDFTVILPG